MGQLGRRCTIQVDGRRLEVSVLAKDYVIVAMLNVPVMGGPNLHKYGVFCGASSDFQAGVIRFLKRDEASNKHTMVWCVMSQLT